MRSLYCLYCPKRVSYSQLKFHIAEKHSGSSFTCNVTRNCSVALMEIGRIVDHLNNNHRKNVRYLIQSHGKHWENKIPQLAGELNSLIRLPSDLRRLTCRKCDVSFLSQDQSALEEHFRLDHPDLHSAQYTENIVYSCRVCNGVVFGSEKHLLIHLRDSHQSVGPCSPAPADLESLVAPKEVRSERFVTEKTPEPSCLSDPDQEDLERYREIISKIKTKKLKNTRKVNTFQTKKVSSDNTNHSDTDVEDSSSKKAAPVNEEVTCHFCSAVLFQSRLSSHLGRHHQAEMFSCDGSCGRQVFSPWQERLLLHLRRDHTLLSSKTEQDLLEQELRLPANLEMIRCRGGRCGGEATFLARHLNSLGVKTLLRHSERKHRGQPIEECFVLGCRVCPRVWSLGEVETWAQHCRQHHTTGLVKQQLAEKTQLAVESAGPSGLETDTKTRGEENLFTCRISDCLEGSKTFLEHLKAQYGYSEDGLKESRESRDSIGKNQLGFTMNKK